VYGVWANKNCEMVITPKLLLFFGRTGDSIDVIVMTISNENSCKCYKLKKAIRFDVKTNKSEPVTLDINDIFLTDISHDTNMANKSTLFLNDGTLYLKFNLYPEISLKQIEKVKIIEPSLLETANETNVGHCLKTWNLLALLQEDENTFALRINTNKHLYEVQFGFHETYGQVIYCHASHVKSCNQGIVFDQYIRLLHNKSEFSAKMCSDNLARTGEEIEINYQLFKTDSCNITDNSGVYWSVKGFQPDEIVLNQCDGDMSYYRYPPEMLIEAGAECFELTV